MKDLSGIHPAPTELETVESSDFDCSWLACCAKPDLRCLCMTTADIKLFAPNQLLVASPSRSSQTLAVYNSPC